MITAMAENLPGRSDPRSGGAVTGAGVRVWRLRFVCGGWGIVMIAGLVEIGEEEGEGRMCVRKSRRGSWRVPWQRSTGAPV